MNKVDLIGSGQEKALFAGREIRAKSKTIHLLDVQFAELPRVAMTGYAGLATLLRFQDVPITTVGIFNKAHGPAGIEYSYSLMNEQTRPDALTFSHLAAVAEEIIAGAGRQNELQVNLWGVEKYADLQHKVAEKRGIRIPDHQIPFEVLDEYLTQLKVPCLVRASGHSKVAVGVDESAEDVIGRLYKEYYFHDLQSSTSKITPQSQSDFEDKWKKEDPAMNKDHPELTPYLILAIRKR